MDPKKASNVEIVLKKFKMPCHCIADVRSPCPQAHASFSCGVCISAGAHGWAIVSRQ